jgi:hypothetical protein
MATTIRIGRTASFLSFVFGGAAIGAGIGFGFGGGLGAVLGGIGGAIAGAIAWLSDIF